MDSEEKAGEQSIYKSVWQAMHPSKVMDAFGISKLRDEMVVFSESRLRCKAKNKVDLL